MNPNIFICSHHWGRFLLLICLLACSSSCMARRRAWMTSRRKGWRCTRVSGCLRGPIPSGQSCRHLQRPPSSSHTHLAGLRSAWLAGPGRTLPCSQRSPSHSLAAPSSQRAQASLTLAAVTQGRCVISIMTKLIQQIIPGALPSLQMPVQDAPSSSMAHMLPLDLFPQIPLSLNPSSSLLQMYPSNKCHHLS